MRQDSAFISGILRTDQGQALSVAYESVQWVDQVDPVRKPAVSSLRAEVEFTDAAFISPREAVPVTEAISHQSSTGQSSTAFWTPFGVGWCPEMSGMLAGRCIPDACVPRTGAP